MFLEHINVLGHSDHHVDKARSVRTEVFEDTLQRVHVSLLTHLLEYKHHGIHGTTSGIELVDSARRYRQFLLYKIVLGLEG